MKYIELINQKLKSHLSNCAFPICIFGQNVAAGSYLGGLTKDLTPGIGGRIINTPNCELTLCGVGMGIMAHGGHAIFFMKQLDFLLLGMDQLTHTWNALKSREGLGSFTIFTVITDSGLEGKQSCFQRPYDLAHCANVELFKIHDKASAEYVIDYHLINKGFRIIAVSQTLLQKEIE